MTHPERIVLFVCQHGAFRSRLAAALYNAVAPSGWQGESAGLEPSPEVTGSLASLLDGDSAASLVDWSPPRPVDEFARADNVVAIDCLVDGAEIWNLTTQDSGAGIRDELRERVRELALRQSALK